VATIIVDEVSPQPSGGTITNVVPISGYVFTGQPSPISYAYHQAPFLPPRIPPRNTSQYKTMGTVGVFFYELPYTYEWGEIYHPRPPIKSIFRPPPDVFLAVPAGTTPDYGWTAIPRLPVALKPSNARLLRPDTHVIVPGSTFNYEWTIRREPPFRVKPIIRHFNDVTFTSNVNTSYRYDWMVPRGKMPLKTVNFRPDAYVFTAYDYRTLVTGTITDNAGNPATSGYVLFELMAGLHEEQYYRIQSTSLILRRTVRATISSSGTISQRIWGNDLITPSGSWYKVTIVPNGRIRQVTRHIYISGATYDLNSPVFV
jgi:hypothetical protein